MTLAEQKKQARQMRDEYIAAEMAVLKNQSYSIGGQTLTRASLDQIRKGRQEWENKLATLNNYQARSYGRFRVWDD